MKDNDDLLEEDLVKFAAKHYYSPKGKIDPEEFYNDLKRFKYIKRLVNRYLETGNLSERLILNHSIVIFNVFGNYGALKLLGLRLEDKHWEVMKPFLQYLNYVRPYDLANIQANMEVIEKLKRI
jgi:hypothetical protein